MLTVAGVISTLAQVGADAPAFKALFDQVVSTFKEGDQVKLREQYDNALAVAEAAHRDAQSIPD